MITFKDFVSTIKTEKQFRWVSFLFSNFYFSNCHTKEIQNKYKTRKEKKSVAKDYRQKWRGPEKKLETLWAIRPPRTNCCRSNTSGTGQA